MTSRPKLFVLASASVFLIAFSIVYFTAPPITTTKKELNYAVLSSALIDAVSMIASEKKVWSKSETKVSIQSLSTGRETAESLIGGASDYANFAELPFVLASTRDKSLRIVATLTEARSLGIVVDTSKVSTSIDLRNRRIGVSIGTTGQLALLNFLKANNLASTDVQLVNLNPTEMVAALTTGDLDAICTWQPFVQIATMREPSRFRIIEGSQDSFVATYFLVSKESTLRANPAGSSLLIRGLVAAQEAIYADPEKAKSIVSAATKLDLSQLNAVWPLFDFHIKSAQQGLPALQTAEGLALEARILPVDYKKQDWSQFMAKLDQ